MLICNVFLLQPLTEVREVVLNFSPDENPIDHVATKQTHFYLISQVGIHISVLGDHLKDVGCCGSIREFNLIKLCLLDGRLVAFLEIGDGHVSNNFLNLSKCVFKGEL